MFGILDITWMHMAIELSKCLNKICIWTLMHLFSYFSIEMKFSRSWSIVFSDKESDSSPACACSTYIHFGTAIPFQKHKLPYLQLCLKIFGSIVNMVIHNGETTHLFKTMGKSCQLYLLCNHCTELSIIRLTNKVG